MLNNFLRRALPVLSLLLLPAGSHAQSVPLGPASTAFCLFEAPPDGERRVWLNLGIVQYLELRSDELRVYYGGGNFGGGHELRVRIASRDEGLAFMQKMQAAAARCAAQPNKN
ncbi:MAG TPA: hypothetical protein VI279_07705 [Rhodocyclaceae bacterium]